VKRLPGFSLCGNATTSGSSARRYSSHSKLHRVRVIRSGIVNVCRGLNDPYPYFRGIISEIGYSTATIPTSNWEEKGHYKNNFYTLTISQCLGLPILQGATAPGYADGIRNVVSEPPCGPWLFRLQIAFLEPVLRGYGPCRHRTFPLFIGAAFFHRILGEYIGAIHTQVLNRPLVVEKERINFTDPTDARCPFAP